VRPVQSALQGVAHRDLLVILGVIAGLGSGRPRGAGKLVGLGFTARLALQQGRARVLLGLLDLQGGDSCCALGGNALSRGRGGLAWRGNLIGG
jgi:hypothetical protein